VKPARSVPFRTTAMVSAGTPLPVSTVLKELVTLTIRAALR